MSVLGQFPKLSRPGEPDWDRVVYRSSALSDVQYPPSSYKVYNMSGELVRDSETIDRTPYIEIGNNRDNEVCYVRCGGVTENFIFNTGEYVDVVFSFDDYDIKKLVRANVGFQGVGTSPNFYDLPRTEMEVTVEVWEGSIKFRVKRISTYNSSRALVVFSASNSSSRTSGWKDFIGVLK